MKKITLFEIFLIIISFNFNMNFGFAQVTEEWVSRYNGTGNGEDYATDIVTDDNGNVYVTGNSRGKGTGNDYTTIKFDQAGDTLWVRRYNGPDNGDDRPHAIALDDSGNVFITGGSTGLGTYSDFFTIKYSSNGDVSWTQRWDSDTHQGDGASSIVLDSLGNVYVAGSAYRGGNAWDAVTIKYNSTGVEQWVSLYSGQPGDFDQVHSIVLDNFGNIYVAGRCGENGYGEYLTIKYNSTGDTLWTKKYDGPANGVDEGFAMTVDESGNAYVTGRSLDNTSGYDYATIKYSPSGETVWVRRYNGAANDVDEAYDIAVDNSGNIYVTGKSNGQGGSIDFVTIKYNTDGVEQWVQRYNGTESAYDIAYSIALDDSGNVYVTGESNSGNPSYVDFATVKYNSVGVEQWVQKYNGPVNSGDYAKVVTVDGLGNVYVAGHSPGIGFNYDLVTIKYSQNITSVYESDNKIPDSYSLNQNYPNPFNPLTTINFTIPNEEFVNLKVFNTLGQEVATLVNKEISAGSYSVPFDAARLTSGIYIYKISAGSFAETKKMILLK